jgi:hypothetical protein
LAFLAEEDTCPRAFPVEAFHGAAFLVEAFPAEACLAEAFPAEACPEEACLATDGACLAAENNKESFLVKVVAYACQGKAVAASVRADSIEYRRVAVASRRAWVVDPGAEVLVRGAAAGRHFAVAVVFVAAAAASVSGAHDKVAFED